MTWKIESLPSSINQLVTEIQNMAFAFLAITSRGEDFLNIVVIDCNPLALESWLLKLKNRGYKIR